MGIGKEMGNVMGDFRASKKRIYFFLSMLGISLLSAFSTITFKLYDNISRKVSIGNHEGRMLIQSMLIIRQQYFLKKKKKKTAAM